MYDSWDECQAQVDGYPGARYKAFGSNAEAVAAFRGRPSEQLGIIRSIVSHGGMKRPAGQYSPPVIPGIRLDAIAVDGACAGNPGRMEYRGVRVGTGEVIFHIGGHDAALRHQQYRRIPCDDTCGGAPEERKRHKHSYIHGLQNHPLVA